MALSFLCVVLVTHHLFSGVGHMRVGAPDGAFRGQRDLKICLLPASSERAASERSQWETKAPCHSDTAGCWVIYNTCESDQMQIVHADD